MFSFRNVLFLSLALALFSACGGNTETDAATADTPAENPDFQISLAQWSLHKSIFGELGNDWSWFGRMLQESPDSLLRGEIDPMDFPQIAAEEFDIHIIELVNTFYYGKANDMSYWEQFKAK